MKKRNLLLCGLVISFILLSFSAIEAKTITENEMGIHDGYDYEYWKDSGYGSMTLGSGGTFSCQWSNINNILFRKGRKFDQTKTYQEIGNITIEYGVDYNPSGNSYLCVYGWTLEPLVEYYIVESWGSWRPPGATAKGTITVDGGVYDIYETTRENQPSIIGTATFQQYWSVRRERKTSGTVSVSEHFKKWESMGMPMGKMYEVALTIEGYQSSGTADVYKNNLILGSSGDPGQPDSRSAFETIQAEEYNSTSSGTLEIIGTGSGGRGIGYIESGDTVTYSGIDFGDGAGKFIIRYASEVDDTEIELRLGSSSGTLLGTFSVEPTGGWNDYIESSMKINRVTGAHDLVLCFTGPVNIDWFKFATGGDEPGVIPGDLNGDGQVNTSDYVLLRRYLLGTGNVSSNADMNEDGVINSLDYVYLRQYILGIINDD